MWPQLWCYGFYSHIKVGSINFICMLRKKGHNDTMFYTLFFLLRNSIDFDVLYVSIDYISFFPIFSSFWRMKSLLGCKALHFLFISLIRSFNLQIFVWGAHWKHPLQVFYHHWWMFVIFRNFAHFLCYLHTLNAS